MSDVDTLAARLQTELAEARRSLGLPDIELSSTQGMLAEAARIADLVNGRMREIEGQLGKLETTRAAARSYLISDGPT